MDASSDNPLFPSSANVPEMTFKAIVLALILTVILAAANAFLALKVGLTISASIPAAVTSMGILHFFKRSNALESNLVQTSASAGEALASGMVYSLPALIIFHYWVGFNYAVTMLVGLIGGLLGVLFTVPIRKVLLTEPSLRFPEGTAIGNILRINAEKSVGLKDLLTGGAWGAVIALFQTGFKVVAEAAQIWWVREHMAFGLGCGFSPALIGAGYIIGANVGMAILTGVILGWVVGVPILSLVYGIPSESLAHPGQIAASLWQLHIRYIGVGTMMIGGIYAIIGLLRPIYYGIKTSIVSMSKFKKRGLSAILRTERDIPILRVFYGIVLLTIPAYFLLAHFGLNPKLSLPATDARMMVVLCVFFAVVAGFFFSTVCAYFAGLIGSSSSPISSMALMSLILSSLLIMLWLGRAHAKVEDIHTLAAMALAIMITALICSAAAISADIMQDLKAGHMVGATPWKQQVMMMIGVAVSALILPLILDLLFNAYGIGGVLPHAGMDPGQMLLAPQAGLMAAVVSGLFTHQFNDTMLALGMGLAILALLLNPVLQKRGFRIAILPLGLGIYLPISTTTPLILGGLLSWYIKKGLEKRLCNESKTVREEKEHQANQTGLLISCGLVAGASLMAVLLAIPFGIKGNANALRLLPSQYAHVATGMGIVVTIVLMAWLKRRVFKAI